MRWPWNPAAPGRGGPGETPLPYSWGRRHWRMLTAAAVVVVLIAGGIGVWMWKPWSHCGPGLSYTGSVCVGLDLNTSVFKGDDPLSGLEHEITADNDRIKGSDFVTIVYLDDMAPDPASDSVGVADLRHRVEGAITAQQEANTSTIAGGPAKPKVKLLLANYGYNAGNEEQAVTGIEEAQKGQHIAAVTGIGQSLTKTRQAIIDLSAHGIATVGSITSADNLNTDPRTGKSIPNFFRVTSTDSDEARAAAAYIAQHHYKRIVIVQDQNEADDYVQNLGADVSAEFKKKNLPITSMPFDSTQGSHTGMTRSEYMIDQFAQMHSDICRANPDLIYFAGRGVDLRSFLTALADSGACGPGQLPTIDVLTGDDANTVQNQPLPKWHSVTFNVFYTAVATRDEWSKARPADSTDQENYNQFADEFHKNGYHDADLADGHAIMTYDALLTAVGAARNDPEIAHDPGDFSPYTVKSSFLRLDCANPVSGAGGRIAFYPRRLSSGQGDPIDKAIPIMQIQQNGQVTQQAPMEWPAGKPFDDTSECGGSS